VDGGTGHRVHVEQWDPASAIPDNLRVSLFPTPTLSARRPSGEGVLTCASGSDLDRTSVAAHAGRTRVAGSPSGGAGLAQVVGQWRPGLVVALIGRVPVAAPHPGASCMSRYRQFMT
jgi:hypothetical protein